MSWVYLQGEAYYTSWWVKVQVLDHSAAVGKKTIGSIPGIAAIDARILQNSISYIENKLSAVFK